MTTPQPPAKNKGGGWKNGYGLRRAPPPHTHTYTQVPETVPMNEREEEGSMPTHAHQPLLVGLKKTRQQRMMPVMRKATVPGYTPSAPPSSQPHPGRILCRPGRGTTFRQVYLIRLRRHPGRVHHPWPFRPTPSRSTCIMVQLRDPRGRPRPNHAGLQKLHYGRRAVQLGRWRCFPGHLDRRPLGSRKPAPFRKLRPQPHLCLS